MYQGYDGQWYEDDGSPAQNAPDSGGSPAPPTAGAPPPPQITASNPSAPNGVPDPNHPGFDTNGWPLASTPNAPGNVITKTPGGSTISNTNTPTAPPPPAPPPPDGPGQLASPGSGGGFFPTYTVPTPYQFTPYSDFTPFNYAGYSPLTADQAAAEPGYDFAKQQGRDAIQTAQANKGNVLSGAALKDLFAWGDQFAGQNYQGAEARNENVYKMGRDNAYGNWAANETGKYQQWAGNQQYGLPAWQANNQPGQFGASLASGQAGLTLADLFNRFNTTTNSLTNIATAGAH